MRALLVVLALTAPAAADSKTKQLAKDYDKELAACKTRSDGVAKVTAGTKALVDDGQKQYQSNLDALAAGLDQVKAYCGELTATLELLADANATYKSLEKQLDDHDNKIRKLRQTSKKAVEDLAPVMGKMIPAINARAGTAAPVTKKVPLKFPSGRAVDAPALAGTWKVSGTEASDAAEYTEGKQSATISVRLVANATCERQRKSITAPSTVDTATKPAELAWYVAYAKDTRTVHVGCRALKAGALVATLDAPGGTWPDLEPVMTAMLAARK